jgi:hypothetical protein
MFIVRECRYVCGGRKGRGFFFPAKKLRNAPWEVVHPPPPSAHLRLFWREKKIKFLFPAATEENIARVNLLRKASDSSILMAIDALDAILSIHLLPLAKI